MMPYYYEDTLPGGEVVNRSIQHNLSDLIHLINYLKSYNTNLISYNSEGILTEYIEISFSPPPTLTPLDLTIIDELKNDININYSNSAELTTRFSELLDKFTVFQIKESTKNEKNEITDEFFLLFDMLPENIKKELRIYIKKEKL
jgi:hypothetical protein